jgi:NADPH-dependent 2,4-dienoyl-CoA reductase/sulfur reductase-like enzyme
MKAHRRDFLKSAAAASGVVALGAPAALGQAKPRVVVIGGGPGGATAAKYIARDSKGAVEVILVEPAKQFVTCFHSNLYLGGFKSMQEITHSYDALASKYGVQLAHQAAAAIDRDKKQVRLADGVTIGYDRLVVSPGIDLKYDSVPGWGKAHEDTMPHAWKAGPQTVLLKARLDAVPDGGVIVMIAPPNPYRCPPGPYERVSMMAHALKKAGKTKAKIVVIDPKKTFSKQGLFQEGWERHYPGMVEWMAPDIHSGLKAVDPASNTVETGFETYKNCALVNVIPAQTAGKIALDAGLADASGFCPIDPSNMRSAMDANIHVLGDASIAGDMPKSAFSANSQAKVAALMIRGELVKSPTFPARYSNTCWSLIDTDDTVKVGGRYEAKDGKIAAVETFVSKTGETPQLRKETQAENMGWYSGITADMFG